MSVYWLGQESGITRWRVDRRRPCSLGFDFMAAVVKSRGCSSPHEVLSRSTGWTRNPVKSGGDGGCGSIGSPVVRPMAAGNDDPGGSSPSELCIGVHNCKV